MHLQANTTHDVDLSAMGFPYVLKVNPWLSDNPLYWETWQDEELVAEGAFLDTPGLTVDKIFSPQQLSDLPNSVQNAADMAPFLAYEIIQAAMASHEAMQLAESNPLLFVMLVSKAKQDGCSQTEFQQLMLLPRKTLAQLCGFSGSKSCLKILAKSSVCVRYPMDLRNISQVVQDNTQLQRLAHVAQPNENHYLLLHLYNQVFWPNLLEMVERGDSIGKVGHIDRLVRDMVGMGVTRQQLRRVSTYDELLQLHDGLVARRNRAVYSERSREERADGYQDIYGDYPKPPVAGNEHITPIDTWYELISEGIHMSHCVGGYHGRVAKGEVYLYRMENPQRLTIALRKNGERWLLDEVRSYFNKPAFEEALAVIQKWLG